MSDLVKSDCTMCMDIWTESRILGFKPIICNNCTELYIELRRRQGFLCHYHRPGDNPDIPSENVCDLCWIRDCLLERNGWKYVSDELCKDCLTAIGRLKGFPVNDE